MPVITRSQSRKLANNSDECVKNHKPTKDIRDDTQQLVITEDKQITLLEKRQQFINELYTLLREINDVHIVHENNENKDIINVKEIKMLLLIKVFELIENNIEQYIVFDGLHTWLPFLRSLFDKTSEFISDNKNGVYLNVNPVTVQSFLDLNNKIRKLKYFSK